jgi:hypothetical protein
MGDLPSLDYVGQAVSMDNVAQGFVYYAIGSLALHFGLQRARPKEVAPISQGPSSFDSLATIVVLSIAGFTICYLGNRIALAGTLGWLQPGALSAACSLAIAPPRILPERSPLHWGAVFLSMSVCAAAHAIVGLKFMFMLSALPLFWIFLRSKRLRRALVVMIPALGFVYLYAVAPVVEGLRGINHSADIKDSLISDAQNGTLSEVALSYENPILQRLDNVATREFYGLYVAFLVQDVKDNGFRLGQTMEYLVYAFIPRALWPQKPNVSRGSWYTVELGAAESEESATTASALTAEGELYWNFGLPGMICGMALLGWLIARLLWRLAGIDPRTSPVCMLAFLTTALLVSGELEAGTLLVAVIADAIGLWAMAKLYQIYRATSA